MRILIAGVAGAVAMYIWMTIAHMITPLGMIGFQQLPDEASVVAPMQNGMKKGLYIAPWVDMKAKDAMTQYEEKAKTVPSILLLYAPPPGKGMDPKMFVTEFVTELAECLIAAWLLAQAAIAAFAGRVLFVAGVGAAASIATYVPHWNWYGFPLDYTLAQIAVLFIGYLVAAVAIAFLLKPKAA